MRAVLFSRDCGATTGFSTQLSILLINESLPGTSGNVFIEDGNHGASEYWAKVRWDSPKRIVVSYPSHARLFRKETLVKGVAVIYEPMT